MLYESYTHKFGAISSMPQLPKADRLRQPTGHDYQVALVLGSKRLDDGGYVVLPRRLGGFADWLEIKVDGANLNDLMKEPPTVAAIARWIYQEWWTNPTWGNRLVAVIVRQGSTAGAYAPHGLADDWLFRS